VELDGEIVSTHSLEVELRKKKFLEKKNAQEINVKDTMDAKINRKLEELVKHGTNNHHTSISTLAAQRTSVEIHPTIKASGATPLIQRKDGMTATQLLMIKLMAQKNALEINAQNTEDDKIKPNLEKLVKHGILKHLTNMQTMHAELRISAETQMVRKQSGATPLIQRKDGSTVNH